MNALPLHSSYASSLPTPQLAAPSRLPRTYHFLHFQPFCSKSISTVLRPLQRLELLSRSKAFTALSSSSSAISTEPKHDLSEPEIDAHIKGEKFDWFAQWYPVMPVCDLDKRVPHAKKVMGLDIVVWWDRNESQWKIFDDACPHRLAPLSEGRIDQQGRLQCVYHGWCFNGSGDCKLIPQALLDGPPVHTFKKACVAAYPSTVQNDILWFWPNTDLKYKDVLSHKRPPYISELDDPSFTKLMMHREFPFGYEILTENLLDPAHVPYAHFKILSPPPAANRFKVDREGGGPIDISIKKLDIDGFHSYRQGGNNKFIAPCLIYASFTLPTKKGGTADTGNGFTSSARNSKEPSTQVPERRGLLLFLCIPVAPGKSRLIFSSPRNFAVWVDRFIPRWVFHAQQNLVLDSDLYLLHVEERKILDIGPSNWQKACFVPTKSDAQVVAFRRWLKRYSGGGVNWGGKFEGSLLPPTPPREQLLDRYWSHVVNCSSCSFTYKVLNALEVVLQVICIAFIGIVAAAKQNAVSATTRTILVAVAILCFAASRWLTHFIYKIFRFHDYSHALL